MTKRLLIFFFVLCLGTSGRAWAAAPVPLEVSLDHGVSLTLSAPAASVFIANPDIADVQVMSPTSIMIFGKRTGETTFMASDAAGNTLTQRTVVVMQDLSDLRQELDTAIPGNRIHAQALPNGIVLTGEATDPSAVADAYKLAQRYISPGGDIINRVRVVGSNQIQIRVRFAEVQRTINDSLGIDWANLANVGGFAFGIATGNTVNTALQGTTGTGGATGLFPRPNNTTLSEPNDILGFSHTGKRFDLNGMIDALAQDGLVTILAEPNLTAMSGETASFLAGGEFPIPVPQGNNTISIDFKPYGISLEFTPTLISENRINLHVKPEVSELSQTGSVVIDNITVPALTTRKAETTVEVASGQSFAIAGLLDNSQTQIVNKFPLLGDLPVIGALFRSNNFQSGQTELVVIITPYIVRPSSDQQLALPTDGFSPPSQSERLLGLRYSSGDPATRVMSGTPTAVRALPPDALPASAPPAGPVAVPTAPVTETPLENPVAAPAADITPPPVVPPAPAAPAISISPNPVRQTPLRGEPDNSSPTTIAPAGPGGFLLE